MITTVPSGLQSPAQTNRSVTQLKSVKTPKITSKSVEHSRDYIQEIEEPPWWRRPKEHALVTTNKTKIKMMPDRFNFNIALAKKRLKSGNVFVIKAKEAAGINEIRKKFLQYVLYVSFGEKEIELARQAIIELNHDINQILLSVFGKHEKLSLVTLQNRLEVAANVRLELEPLKLLVRRFQQQVAYIYQDSDYLRVIFYEII